MGFPNSNSNPNSKSNPNNSYRSTIFINNLPKGLDIFGFKGIFNKAGSVLDAYIPAAPVGKRRFGFIRFKNPESVSKSIQIFHNRVIRDSKITVFEAKRDLVAKQNRKSEINNFAEARRNDSHTLNNQGTVFSSHLLGNKINRFNFKDVNKRPCIKGKVSKEKLSRLLNSLVGETETPVRAEVIWNKLSLENVGVLKVSAIQKNKFILEFATENEADLALTGSQTLSDLFPNLKKWAWTDHTEERFVWLEVLGVPPQGWNLENFRDLGLIWGKLVGFDNSLDETFCQESLKMLVLTNKWSRIEEEVYLDLEGTSFKIWVEEIDEPILSQFYKAGAIVSEDFGHSAEESEEEGEYRAESFHSKQFSKSEVAVEVGSKKEDKEDDGEHSQVDAEVQGGPMFEEEAERVDDSLESSDVGLHGVEELKSSKEALYKEDPEDFYESDDCPLSLSSIPKAFSSVPSCLKVLESDVADSGNSIPDGRPVDSLVAVADSSRVNADQSLEVAPVKTLPPVDQSSFCFGATHACQDRTKPSDFSSKPKKNLKLGEKRKARSPRGRGSSSRRKVVKRRKRKFVSVPLAVEDGPSGNVLQDGPSGFVLQDEVVGSPKFVNAASIEDTAVAEVHVSDSPDNYEASLRAQAIRQMHSSNRHGLKIVPGEKNEEAYIQRTIRQIKERKRYIEQCISEENSAGSSEF